MHTRSLTENLGRRRGEVARMENTQRRRDRIQEAVRAKMQLGMSYYDAWAAVKRQNPQWFGEIN